MCNSQTLLLLGLVSSAGTVAAMVAEELDRDGQDPGSELHVSLQS